jgi:hypothetical protein
MGTTDALVRRHPRPSIQGHVMSANRKAPHKAEGPACHGLYHLSSSSIDTVHKDQREGPHGP